jgi:hypothetical protein
MYKINSSLDSEIAPGITQEDADDLLCHLLIQNHPNTTLEHISEMVKRKLLRGSVPMLSLESIQVFLGSMTLNFKVELERFALESTEQTETLTNDVSKQDQDELTQCRPENFPEKIEAFREATNNSPKVVHYHTAGDSKSPSNHVTLS